MSLADEAAALSSDVPAAKGPRPGQASVEWDGIKGTLTTGTMTEEPKSWTDLIVDWGLDPDEVQVVPGSVQIRAWDANVGGGEIKRLRYYKASLERRTSGIDVEDLEQIKKALLRRKPVRRSAATGHATGTRVVLLSDWQIGKADGDGLEGSIQRIITGLEGAARLAKGSERIVLAGLGDIVEQCFAGETLIQTWHGIRPLNELAGQTVRVKSTNGKWVDAKVKSFGVQALRKVTLSRSGAKKEIYATGGHRWFALNDPRSNRGTHEVVTDDLVPGSVLASIFGGSKCIAASPFGVAHGMVFGDGHRRNKDKPEHGCSIALHRGDWWALDYFPLCRRSEPRRKTASNLTMTEDSDFIMVDDIPTGFKELPSMDESINYLKGWLAGYIAADGSVGATITLSSATREHLVFAAGVAARLGIGTQPITKSMRKGCGSEPSPLYRLTFVRSTVPADLMVHPAKRAKFEETTSDRPATQYVTQRNNARNWRVVSVEETDRVEEVYCAVVPERQAFVLDNDILTGNCAGHYPGQAFTVELDRREQMRVARRLILRAVDLFAPLAPLDVVAVPGNHGENRLNGKAFTQTSDNDDVAVFEQVADIVGSSEKFPDVRFGFPPEHDQTTVTLDIGPGIALNHGHNLANGATGQQKANTWWKGQMAGHRPAGDCDILITGHYHHFVCYEGSGRTWFQCPAMDGGSTWWEDKTGNTSPPGMLSFTVGDYGARPWGDLALT